MANLIDARGRSCPEPVIMAKKELEKNNTDFNILVDTNVAVENITRFANSKGYKVNVSETNGDFNIALKK